MIISCHECTRPAVILAPRDTVVRNRLPYCRNHGPESGTPIPRVSDGMFRALQCTWEASGATKLGVANMMAPRKSRAYAYRAIDRAIEANLILAVKEKYGYALTPTRLGRAMLGQVQTTT